MGAFRERYFARDGVGHADRPWLDNPLSLDAQSRGVRFPIARRRGIANSNPDSNSYRNSNSYPYSYSYTRSKADADSKASSDSKASTVILQIIGD
jgi:hypothetical protein